MTITRSAMLRCTRRAVGRGVGAVAALLLAVGCSEEPTRPLDDVAGSERPGALTYAVQRLECTMDLARGGDLECEPAAGAGSAASGGPNYNLIVGSQHRFVRMANEAPSVDGDVWRANVTVQNLTLQPMAKNEQGEVSTAGVRVFFVEEPNNGVEVLDHDGVDTFTGSEPQKYYEYAGATLLGDDEILTPGETSGAKMWQFALNGATTFRFSVLIWTTVPDPGAYSVRLTRISAGYGHTCGDGPDGKFYCWGNNFERELGHQNGTWNTTPIAAPLPAGVASWSVLVAGGRHTCALGSDGKWYCWGENRYGQLGICTTHPNWPWYVSSPDSVRVPSGVTLSSLSLGDSHNCALSAAGPAYCWGLNANAQFGNGRTSDTNIPVFVAGSR